jgi:site-specific DNA-methyltransferase (adenine-specific)
MKTPYYEDEYVTLYCGDCRDIVPHLGRFDLLLTDPPYGRVKGDFDMIWQCRELFLEDCQKWRDMMLGVMKENATLWWFAWPSNAGRIEAMLAEKLNVLSHVVWIKPCPTAQITNVEALRAPHPETERIIMAERYEADELFLKNSSSERPGLFAGLRDYLIQERDKAGLTNAEVNQQWRKEKGGNGGMASHWFTDSQWQLPTPENYQWLQKLFNRGRGEYKILNREYEELKKEYEELRRYFALEKTDPKTELWRFKPSLNKHGHPTEKPLSLISFMVRISSRQDQVILDPFAGSGTTGVAAKLLNRKCTLIEKEEKYCEIAARRLSQGVLPLF